VLSTPPAFVLSQDQTLQTMSGNNPGKPPQGKFGVFTKGIPPGRVGVRKDTRPGQGFNTSQMHWLLAHC
ncbi:hypothetical protein, partial [Rhizohabitans arisaemae]|uniref:hypothetical protein n=1 Tax=Rhizohabitans arisaemae TaxID=2720610 RepID=UPI0024B2325D